MTLIDTMIDEKIVSIRALSGFSSVFSRFLKTLTKKSKKSITQTLGPGPRPERRK